ncbi:3-hydroxyacyl-CoA dehydrogenase [Chryseobacterium gleum]|uniref:3-hydroxyacyl-CoA dehydrogenase n=1 Tax=Chryseobacterium gleum TaxID=250 RepID=UPI00241EAABC|nr:3-hydroxyacyl-CoA dehydrogenase [Chryseobacterium gleum]
MNIKNVAVAGSGVLGGQIAFQTAFHGFTVKLYDINDEVLAKAKKRFETELSENYKTDLKASEEEIKSTLERISYTANLAEAVAEADLIIEAIPENVEIKKDFYHKLAAVAPEETIFATNSSTLLPSQFAEDTGRPEKFCALHFANEIWIYNTAEIMGHPGTDKVVFDTLVEFAKQIGMVPLEVHKEQPGYILNSLLVPFLSAGWNLLVNEVADAKTIDKTWMIATGAPKGPFGFVDMVGLNTVYNIDKNKAEKTQDPFTIKKVQYIKEHFIDKNKLGMSTGEGFYTYPNPEYKQEDFLK